MAVGSMAHTLARKALGSKDRSSMYHGNIHSLSLQQQQLIKVLIFSFFTSIFFVFEEMFPSSKSFALFGRTFFYKGFN